MFPGLGKDIPYISLLVILILEHTGVITIPYVVSLFPIISNPLIVTSDASIEIAPPKPDALITQSLLQFNVIDLLIEKERVN